MQHLILSVRKIVERIKESENRRRKLAEFVRALQPELQPTRKVSQDPLSGIRIAAVDGGLVKKSLHGMDCLLVRAAAVCFQYRAGKTEAVQYYPSKSPAPKAEVYEALSEIEWNQFASLNRLKEEITTAAACLDSLQPDLLLLDGMLLPHYLDKPSASSPLQGLFSQLLLEYAALFSRAAERGVALAGIIEDSRNTVFCDYLSREILSNVQHGLVPELQQLLQKTMDSNLLHLVLEKGERTIPFPAANPAAAEVSAPPIQSFYLKTARFDRPLRVDFLPGSIGIDTLSGILLSISGHHSGYGMPVPLIEADNIARLSENEMERFYSAILSLAGNIPSTMRLRREQRPF